jgi:predicted kinase
MQGRFLVPPTVRMVVLVGIPGSGKSFVAEQLREKGWVIVSQDELGNRKECEKQAARALQQGRSVLIDRTNFDNQQRSHWLRIAGSHGVAATAVYLDVDIDTCKARVMSRSGHPTLKPSPLSLEIVDRFLSDLETPTEDEGFRRVVVLREGETLSSRLADIIG